MIKMIEIIMNGEFKDGNIKYNWNQIEGSNK